MTETPAPRVALFVTCVVDLMRPSVGFAAVHLLEAAGAEVSVPAAQTCCGQPAYNSGDRDSARDLARRMVSVFEGFDYVVAPSGSCAAMLRHHYPALLADDGAYGERARDLAERTHELTAFLADVMDLRLDQQWAAIATYHDSCSGLREMGVKDQPRRLLARVGGLSLTEMGESEACCGFGGTFCVKYPPISAKIVDRKADDATGTGAGMVLGGDLGCLLHLAGRLRRRGLAIQVRHVAEVLAGQWDIPAIGEPGD